MTDTKKLRELANAATPGPWEVSEYLCEDGEVFGELYIGKEIIYLTGSNTATYIAAANPEAVLGLIARIEKLEAALQFYALRDNYYQEFGSGSDIGNDHGEIAREALKEET